MKHDASENGPTATYPLVNSHYIGDSNEGDRLIILQNFSSNLQRKNRKDQIQIMLH